MGWLEVRRELLLLTLRVWMAVMLFGLALCPGSETWLSACMPRDTISRLIAPGRASSQVFRSALDWWGA